ncbi:hypothetical protein GFL84_18035 [Rhizobium leguminosarum bv. viciae]|nr:hypothetical protein [Rhizobium leguminosarum bv. viciae]
MSRKSVQRFCDNDMRKNKDLKREERISKIAARFSLGFRNLPDSHPFPLRKFFAAGSAGQDSGRRR